MSAARRAPPFLLTASRPARTLPRLPPLPVPRLVRLLLLAVALAPAASAQLPVWELLPASPFNSYRFEDATFVSPQHGWIVSGVGAGETWETTDGGLSWAMRSSLPRYLRTTVFPTPARGFTGTLYGAQGTFALLETTDGGASYLDASARIVPALGGGNGICGLFAFDAETIWGVGQWYGPAYVIHTTDGGATWTRRDLSTQAGSLIDVYFHDAMNGIAVGGTLGTSAGGRALVLGTTDGGVTWAPRFTSSGAGTNAEWAWKISFPTPSVGYVSVEYSGATTTGKVLKTTDGGLTWTELPVPEGRSMQGIGFLTPEIGWTSGRGTVMRTLDGGATWAPSVEMDGQVNRFEFFGDSLGFAMGQRIYRLRFPTVDSVAPPGTATLRLDTAPNPAPHDVVVGYAAPVGAVAVEVFDALGRRVAVLDAPDATPTGVRQVVWRASAHPPGVYVVRLTAGDASVSRRVLLAR